MVMVKLIWFVDVDVACMLTWYAAFACYGLERFQPLFSWSSRFITIGGQSILQYYSLEKKMEDSNPSSAFVTVKNHHCKFFLLLKVDL